MKHKRLPSKKTAKKSKKRIFLLVKITLIGLILFFMLQKLYSSWDKVSSYRFRFNLFSLITSLILVIIGFAMFSRVWAKILLKMRIKLGYLKAYNIWSKSQMFKYVPGLVWIALSRAYICEKEGIKKRNTVISVILENMLMVLSASILSIYFILINLKVTRTGIIYLIIIIAGLSAIHPKVFNLLINIALRIFKLKKISLKLNYLDVLGLLSNYVFIWIIMGSGFYFFSNSIYPISFKLLPYFVSVFSFAWATGFIIVFIPGGLGVREGLISILIRDIVSVPIAIVIAFSARIWWMFGEASSFVISSSLRKIGRKSRL
ncbi:hypothetical protein KY366_00355 [Candidatus Woesearchaeota archaeon]|nr:hypothetical protein [Candidatus Woesearchaeota archaeon]